MGVRVRDAVALQARLESWEGLEIYAQTLSGWIPVPAHVSSPPRAAEPRSLHRAMIRPL